MADSYLFVRGDSGVPEKIKITDNALAISVQASVGIGSLTETAPTTDTASSGLNGRLQRIAQRITSLIALLPTALGAGGGLKVDGSGTALPVSGSVTADTELPAAVALNGTIVKSVSAPVVGAGLLVNDGTNLVQAKAGAQGGVVIEGVASGTAIPVSIAASPALVASTANIGKTDVPTATSATYNLTCTVADTEYSQALDANCRGFEFQARTEAILRWADVTGKVAAPTAPYRTLKAGDYYASPQLNQLAAPSTLYFASPTAGTVVELIVWI